MNRRRSPRCATRLSVTPAWSCPPLALVKICVCAGVDYDYDPLTLKWSFEMISSTTYFFLLKWTIYVSTQDRRSSHEVGH